MIVCFKKFHFLKRHDVIQAAVNIRSGSTKVNLVDDSVISFEHPGNEESEDYNIRNKSRLKFYDYNILHNKMPFETPMSVHHTTLKYKREMFGKYGYSSGVDPALCFDTKEEIGNIQEYEKVAYDLTIQQMKEIELQNLENEKIKKEEYLKRVEQQMALQQEWIEKITEKRNKKLEEARLAQEKREKLIKEVRKELGYEIDPADPRFLEVLEQKELEIKRIKKREKKKKREEYLLAKIAALESGAQLPVENSSDNKESGKSE